MGPIGPKSPGNPTVPIKPMTPGSPLRPLTQNDRQHYCVSAQIKWVQKSCYWSYCSIGDCPPPAKISVSHPYLLVQGAQEHQVSLVIQDHLYFLLAQFLQSHLFDQFLLCFLVELVFQAAPVVLDSLFRAHTGCNLCVLKTRAQGKITVLSNCIPSGFISLIQDLFDTPTLRLAYPSAAVAEELEHEAPKKHSAISGKISAEVGRLLSYSLQFLPQQMSHFTRLLPASS